MTKESDEAEATLVLAARVADVLHTHRADSVVIGAVALAVHNHPRDTEDLDLAVALPLGQLRIIAATLRATGLEAELAEPDAIDPLGGVLTIRGPGAQPVQVVNFDNAPANGFPALVRSAARTATPLEGHPALRIVDLPHLIASKLYAGGAKSKLDVLELLVRNPIDLEELRRFCAGFHLEAKLDRLLADARNDDT